MNINNLEAILESVLFAAGESVDLDRLSDALNIERQTIKSILTDMASKYEASDRGIMLLSLENSYQLCTKPIYAQYIRDVLQKKRHTTLSSAALEVLSIIAYNQPTTRTFVEQVRRVDSTQIIENLVEKGFLEECGKLDAPGRPNLYGTTTEFLRVFGFKALSDLPELPLNPDESGDRIMQFVGNEVV